MSNSGMRQHTNMSSPSMPQQSSYQTEFTRCSSALSGEQSRAVSISDSTRQSRRLTKANFDDALRYRTMTKFLHGKVSSNGWFEIDHPTRPLGVLVRSAGGLCIKEPRDLSPLLVQTFQDLGLEVAVSIATETTEAILDVISADDQELDLGDGMHLQILESLADLNPAGACIVNLSQHAALLRSERVLLTWHNDVDQVLIQASRIEEKLLELIWGSKVSPSLATRPTITGLDSDSSLDKSKMGFGTPEVVEIVDLEDQEPTNESFARPVLKNGAYIMGASLFFLVFSIFGYSTSHLVLEYLIDRNSKRFLYAIGEPLILCVAMFFSLSLVTYVFQLAGPITGLQKNTRFFSAIKPNVRQAQAQGFVPPKVTIQMAVYKESLELVVMPTVASLLAAIKHYQSLGGTANLFITDDGIGGLLNTNPEEAQARIDYYAANNIGWVARPANGDNGYFRTGRFKKASNSNFCMNFSNRVERTLKRLLLEKIPTDDGAPMFVDREIEESLYQQALAEELAKDPRAKAAGDIRIGEVILMVDSDTRVPVDSLMYGAAEMYMNPEVAIIQHYTSVVQVSGDFFENGASYFAKMCYMQIRFTVSGGEASPFVGHNAFVRWAALQDVGMEPGYTGDATDVMYWSEYHISEDFNMSIRLQSAGWVTRFAAYHKEEFKEMVSLTIYDEISRWERYAYGDSEIIFNPVWSWLWRGPFTKLYKKFMWCNMHLSSKLNIISYMTSYYAIGSGFFYTIANYILVGLYPDKLDKFYMQSWNIFQSVVLVFWILGNIALAVLRWRVGERKLLSSLWENFRWQPMYCFFFYGLSFHVNKALIAHFIGYNMTWEMTKKEVENSNFLKEIPRIFRTFWMMYATMIPLGVGVIYMAFFAPVAWRVTEPIAVVPMVLMIVCHVSLPFALNQYVVTAVDEFKVDEGRKH